jgi:hypothetical protein
MAEEDQLKLVASLTDQMSGPLKEINKVLDQIGKGGEQSAAGRVTRHFQEMSKVGQTLERNIKEGIAPALTAFGLSAGTATGAVYGLARAFGEWTRSQKDIQDLSKASVFSADTIFHLKRAAETTGLQQPLQVAKTMGDIIFRLQHGLQTELGQFKGLQPLIRQIQELPHTAEGSEQAMKLFADKMDQLLSDPETRGSASYISHVLGLDDPVKLLETIRKALADKSKMPIDDKDLTKYIETQNALFLNWQKFKDNVMVAFGPKIVEGLKELNKLFSTGETPKIKPPTEDLTPSDPDYWLKDVPGKSIGKWMRENVYKFFDFTKSPVYQDPEWSRKIEGGKISETVKKTLEKAIEDAIKGARPSSRAGLSPTSFGGGGIGGQGPTQAQRDQGSTQGGGGSDNQARLLLASMTTGLMAGGMGAGVSAGASSARIIQAAYRPGTGLTNKGVATDSGVSAPGGGRPVFTTEGYTGASEGVMGAIESAAKAYGLDPQMMKGIAKIESDLDPGSNRNKRTQYKGLFQLGRGEEWRTYGHGGDIYNARDNARAAAEYMAANAKWFKETFKHDPTPGELYLMHQQGRGFFGPHHTMTNIKGNPYPGMKGPQTWQTFLAGWSRALDASMAKFPGRGGFDSPALGTPGIPTGPTAPAPTTTPTAGTPTLSSMAPGLAPAPDVMRMREGRTPEGIGWRSLDPALREIVGAAANQFEAAHPGYHVEASSGYRKGAGFHGLHQALDVRILDKDGTLISAEGSDPTGLYHELARISKGQQHARHPELEERFTWGGAFPAAAQKGDLAPDLMHFDLGGHRGRYARNRIENLAAIPPMIAGPATPEDRQAALDDRIKKAVAEHKMVDARPTADIKVHVREDAQKKTSSSYDDDFARPNTRQMKESVDY